MKHIVFKGLIGLVLITVVSSTIGNDKKVPFQVSNNMASQGEQTDTCPCKDIDELTQRDLLCMNSAAKIYSCILGVDVEPEEVFSCEWYIYTGEGTILRRYDKDEMPLVIKNNILFAKQVWIRGIRLQDEEGNPTGVYLRKRAKIKFNKRKQIPN